MAAKPKRRQSPPDDTPSLFDAGEPVPGGMIPIKSVSSAGFDQPEDAEASGAASREGAPRTAAVRARNQDSQDSAESEREASVAQTSTRSRSRSAKSPVTAETMAKKQREISVSEFFAKNRHLLGFDNKRKALLTTVKEAVDNSLDACEEAGILPEIHVTIDQLGEDRFRVTVRDNGPGIVKQQIPNVFGKLLYGSKFHRLKMSRGQQGIGISAAGMYGLLTTGRSVRVASRTSPRKPAHRFEIQIDTSKNRPDIVKDEEIDVPWAQGTEVSIELVASFAKGRQSVDEYIEQTAIANPHALLVYKAPTGELREFPRGSDELPAETKEIKPHPYGIELGVLMKMLKEASGVKLAGFLSESFSRVSPRVAQQICDKAKLSTRAAPSSIGTHDVEKLYQAMQGTKILAPPTDCLAPIGVRSLLAGICKEVKAEFYTATTRTPTVYRGNPFQIEIAMAFGGDLSGDQPARVIRFANRVPLLYQQSACAAYKSVMDLDWRNYGLSQPSGSLPVGPLVVLVHMASVWVPFTSESKEAIADYDEIRKETKLALQECGRKLASYVRRRRRMRLEADKRNIFERYIPDVAEAIAALTGEREDDLLTHLQAIAKARTAEADVQLDEDGKPIAKPTLEEEYARDDSTIVIEANAASSAPADNLFDEDATNGQPKRRRRRR